MDSLEILPQENSHLGTCLIFSFPLLQVLQAVMKAGEELGEEGVVPCSKAALCAEQGEHLQEHLMVQTGRLRERERNINEREKYALYWGSSTKPGHVSSSKGAFFPEEVECLQDHLMDNSWLEPSGTGAAKGFLGEPKVVSAF
uniref:Uncharacterized protein n=1 Tax=Pipistrellus kuhlii TaxID=59472 RepID=A0A7J7W3P0_PIPKU|nr:hypothetical protein mPipKuh1_008212 [Pipistrellus kuhlii]